MKITRLTFFVLVAAVSWAVTSCTEKINLQLKNSEPQLVIEGNISDMPGPYYVFLTKSRLYYQDYNFERVSSAQVIISDDAGNSDTLTEVTAGIYQTNFIQGAVGRVYHLQATTEGKLYESYCLLHAPVDIDSIVITEEANMKGELKKRAAVLVHDPPATPNYYRVVSILNDTISTGFKIYRDRLWDGKLREFSAPQSGFKSGDTLQVQLWSIDGKLYDYFREFNQNQSTFGAPAAPANPTSVFVPAALGYFSAQSIKAKTIIIP